VKSRTTKIKVSSQTGVWETTNNKKQNNKDKNTFPNRSLGRKE